ncbi:MAG TPA: FemAB family XrtA/PEP-CTERM system-associated protein [Pirellulales bacterium]
MTVAIIDDDALWNSDVAGHPDATAYHQWAWRDVFAAAFGHASVYLAAGEGSRIAGVLPLVEFRSRLFGTFAVSLPFVNYGGVVADDGTAAGALSARAELLARERGWRHVELRHVRRQFAQCPVKRHKVAMWLSLAPTPELLWSALDRKVRNQVRKAEKSGCTAEHGGAELLDDFYRVFAHNMRDLGTPVYARAFFAEVLRAFPGDTRVFVVRLGGQAVGASITVGWRDKIEVPWASSLRAHAPSSPNTLLYWTMLKWAVERGYKHFDFGRSTPDEGTFHFKKQWGAQPHELAWEYLGLTGEIPDQSPKNPKFRAAIAVWQHLPVWLTNRVGPPIVRSIP